MIDVVVCSAAEKDYAEALVWYAKRSPEAADRFDRALHQAFRTIGNDPDRFPQCDDRHRFYLMQKYPFQIIYRQREKFLDIVAIAHTSRSPGYWGKR